MRETIEFRIPAENATKHLQAGLGSAVGWVRKIELALGDLLVARIGSLQRPYSEKGHAFLLGWGIYRLYSRRDLDQAQLLHVWPKNRSRIALALDGQGQFGMRPWCAHSQRSAIGWCVPVAQPLVPAAYQHETGPKVGVGVGA